MKCYVTNNSPYARKVRVVAFETGLYDVVEWKTITREERGDINDFNPLGKVPVAAMGTGDIVCDSPVICAYLDSLSSTVDLIPKSDPERWQTLTLEALGDGLGDTVIVISQEKQRQSEKYSQEIVDRQTAKIKSTLSVLDSAAIDFKDPPLLGEIAVACAMGYMEFRDIVPEWSGTYVNLAKWYDDILERESFRRTAPE